MSHRRAESRLARALVLELFLAMAEDGDENEAERTARRTAPTSGPRKNEREDEEEGAGEDRAAVA